MFRPVEPPRARSSRSAEIMPRKTNRAFDYGRAAGWLRAAGLRATGARLAVLAELEGDVSHPTADELWNRLQQKAAVKHGGAVSRATVYNCLEALSRIGKVGVLEGSAPRRFDPNCEYHFHAVCDMCGSVRDVDPARVGLKKPGSPKDLPSGFHVSAVDMRFRGICKTCTGRRGER